jgi:hypothetical protein
VLTSSNAILSFGSPGARDGGTFGVGINDAGAVVGYFLAAPRFVAGGFLLTP